MNQGGEGGTDVAQGGSDVGQGGSDSTGEGGAGVGQGGSEQGGAGPVPTCDYQGGTCEGLFYRECDGGEYFEYPCDYNCEDNRGCFGHCTNGDIRCSEETAEVCVDGEWTTSEACPFQCVNGACQGECSPGTVVCDGLSTVTCGQDFQFGTPVACPTGDNATTSCSGGVCGLSCDEGFANCTGGDQSCESDLSSIATCGSCGTACNPDPAHAAPTCSATTGCGFECDDGFADCDGNPSNGCEQNISSDALNCGACGTSCYGTMCTAAQCEYDFQVVSDFSGNSTLVADMAVNVTHVYWLTQTEVRRAPKTGGAYQTLASTATPSAPKSGLVIEAGKVAWAATDGVYVMPKGGGTPARIFTTTSSTAVRGLVTANGKLYWNDSQVDVNEDCITGATFNDQNAFLLCSQGKRTTFRTYDLTTDGLSSWQILGEYSPPLAVADGEMYVANYGPNFPGHAEYEIRMNAYNASTGAWLRQIGGVVRVNGSSHTAHIAMHGAAMSSGAMVYATELNGPEVQRGFVTAPLAGSDPLTTNALISNSVSREFVADAAAVYYRNGTGGVYGVTLEGAPLAPFFVIETNDDIQLAGDDTHIYFTAYTNGGEQAILRAPK
jgi:hypothetical protein